jgi:hypothetical protein
MRYWGYLAAKLAVAGAASYGLLRVLNSYWDPGSNIALAFANALPYTLSLGAWFLFTCALVFLCIRDQRYRCRVCLRRLRMPVETGSWGFMLQLGRPRIEYICPYGHGTLNVEELQITGLDSPDWTPHAEMWEELCASSAKDVDSDQ